MNIVASKVCIPLSSQVRHRKHKMTGIVIASKEKRAHVQWETGFASWIKPNQVRVLPKKKKK